MLAAADKDAAALYEPAVQALPSGALADVRTQRLAALLERIASARSRYGTPGASPAALTAVPPLSGAELAAEVDAHPPFGRFQLRRESFIRAGLATAALPRPMPTAWTRADLDAEARWGARALRRAGLDRRMRSSDCLDGGLVTPGTLAISDALDALDALALPVGPVTSDAGLRRAAEVWEIVHPRVLIVDAPSLAFLYDASGYPRPDAFAVLLVPADAATLAAPPRPDVYRILSVPQVGTFIAGECSAHDGFHLAEDAVAAEIVDAHGAALPDGGHGRLLLTTLTRSLALLRFDTGLRSVLDRAPCGCGETHARLHFA
jgi:phenylacetate-coenzyme A ligase PaaK-like adenylate-forming protein